MTAILFNRFHFFKTPLSSFTMENYYAAPRGLKSITRLLLIPVMMKMRWTIYLKALAVRLIDSSLVKQQIV